MTSIPQLAQTLQTVLTTAAEAAEREVFFTRRPDTAKFSAPTLLQTLLWGHLAHPNPSPQHLAQTAAHIGITLSPQAIVARMNARTAALLACVLHASLAHLISSDLPLALPLLQRFSHVFLQDSTTLALPPELASRWPGCGGDGPLAALKCGVQLDLLFGSLTALDLAAGRTSDLRLPMQQARLPTGSLRLADLGFFDLRVLQRLEAQGCYFLSKLRAPTLIRTQSSPAQPLAQFVEQLGDLARWEGWVWLGQAECVQARLLLLRVPEEVADHRRRRLHKEASAKGSTPSAAQLRLAAYTLVVTNAPVLLLSLEEAMVLTKVRWQIELVFKLWKSGGQLGRAERGDAQYQLCTMYAQLLAMLVQHWILVVVVWRYADHSLVKAAQVLRDHASELASAGGREEQLRQVLEQLEAVIVRSAHKEARKKQPHTYQLVLACTRE